MPTYGVWSTREAQFIASGWSSRYEAERGAAPILNENPGRWEDDIEIARVCHRHPEHRQRLCPEVSEIRVTRHPVEPTPGFYSASYGYECVGPDDTRFTNTSIVTLRSVLRQTYGKVKVVETWK